MLYLRLWQIVAERGFEDIVRALRSAAGIGRAACAGPEVAREMAVLDALPKLAFRSGVEVEPVTYRAFLHVFVVTGADSG